MSVRTEVGVWARGLTQTYRQCRDFGHAWAAYTARWDKEVKAFHRVLRCARCETERSQWVSQTGSLGSNSYYYPDGYSAPKGVGRLTADERAEIRLMGILTAERGHY